MNLIRKQVGGDDRKIVVYSRETSSGTYEFFKESVLKNTKTRPIMDGFRKNNVNYWVFREIRSIIPHL